VPAISRRLRTTGLGLSTKVQKSTHPTDILAVMFSPLRNLMRQPLIVCLTAFFAASSLCSTAYAQGVTAAAIKMTVTSHDQDAVNAVARQLAEQGQAVALAITTTETTLSVATKADSRATASVSTTRAGAFTQAQADAAQNECRKIAARPGMSCTIETTYGKL
jgi:hypothetical protein